MSPSIRRALTAAVLVLLGDRAVKVWIVEGLDLRNRARIEVWDPFLNLSMAWNQGVNFGLFDLGGAGRWWLAGLALAVALGSSGWVRGRRGWVAPVAVGALVGGALGNAWDRVQYGAVADFINMSCCGIRNPFAFNLADVAIFVGAAALILIPDRPVAAPAPQGGVTSAAACG